MNVISPEAFKKRSLTYRLHNAAEYMERDGAGLIRTYSPQDSRAQLENCAILDLSELNRIGLRGRPVEAILSQKGIGFPEKPNQFVVAESGALIARLGTTECWVMDNPLAETGLIKSLQIRANSEQDCYPLYCQHSHAWFALTGKFLPELMAKICGVDLRAESFPEGAIVQTSIARVSGIIIHHSINGIPVFSILSDSSSAEYLWHALLDAMQEYTGKPAGLSALMEG